MTDSAGLGIEAPVESTLLVRVWGRWTLDGDLPSLEGFERALTAATGTRRVGFDARGLTDWDSVFPTFLAGLLRVCSRHEVAVDLSGLPEGVRRLLALARAVPEGDGSRRAPPRIPFLARVGEGAVRFWREGRELLAFAGELVLSVSRLARGRARFQLSDLFLFVQQAGASALPIVGLISVLVGVILAFVGAAQLRVFGAQMFVADLVGIGMVREMGAMMTAVIMAGRTGAAYAAQLGTMVVNEEVDALRTFGIEPMDVLVLPRMIAVALMLPLLCVYADLMGVAGGAIVAVGSFDVSMGQYVERTRGALELRHFWVGIAKSAIYGVVVAASGCLRGLRCGRSASAVGDATTSAVVTAIVWIIVWCAVTTVIFHVLGI
ncbi:MAG: ABC transporter permease [Deferrisomatales bacterium]|nr:ABC transporter permease [Deferrisomatales bacterium]